MNDYINASSLEAALDDVIDNATKIAICPSTILSGSFPTYALVASNKLSSLISVTSSDFNKSTIDGSVSLILKSRFFSNAEVTGSGDMACIAVIDDSVTGSEVVKALFATSTKTVSAGTGFYLPVINLPIVAKTAS